MDCDKDESRCGIDRDHLRGVLEQTLEQETELLRVYTITSERIHDNDSLKDRLQNFAEGNAKRTRQLIDELAELQ
ncbi:hypothetical protein PAESOLCIP111_04258 [Paenibacillus solanacearum]|uniref:Uncharacterized protein n=1 Tax=Paenibacillus solanacearum TaxID=2048548 RepID=A0A916K4D7_9BACL|nr:hypothetical protein [Paenibacillus solanacearum]CAG7641679.1 hypothetical protein PAESOLCIP111_04258 [Paenibacillus solanacearum]